MCSDSVSVLEPGEVLTCGGTGRACKELPWNSSFEQNL